MPRYLWAAMLAGLVGIAFPADTRAQDTPPPVAMPFALLDEDRLLRESRLGQQILAGIRAAEERLEQENDAISEQLAEEERALTAARADLSPEAFRARADAFDTRVEQIRAERRQRSEDLARFSEAEAQRFFQAAFPVLVNLMNEEGIIAILKPEAVILAVDYVDITGRAIARLDAAFQPRPDPAVPPDHDLP